MSSTKTLPKKVTITTLQKNAPVYIDLKSYTSVGTDASVTVSRVVDPGNPAKNVQILSRKNIGGENVFIGELVNGQNSTSGWADWPGLSADSSVTYQVDFTIPNHAGEKPDTTWGGSSQEHFDQKFAMLEVDTTRDNDYNDVMVSFITFSGSAVSG